MTATTIGSIMQIAYVVESLEWAIDHWVARMGVGPWALRPHMTFTEFSYRGQASKPDFSCAFAFSGNTQIELIEVHNDEPSVFHDFQRSQGSGLQHVGVLSEDLARDTERLARRGVQPVQQSLNARGFATALFDTDAHHGAMLELIDASPALLEAFNGMLEAAWAWDGRQKYLD